MKMAKRIFAMTLALMMILSLSVAAFAAPGHNHTITIKNSNEGYQYKAYQIFAGTLGSDGVLSNIEWGSGIDGTALLNELKNNYPDFAACENAKDVAKLLSGATGMDHPKAIDFAEIAAEFVQNPGTSSVWTGTGYTISGLEDGYYLVVNTDIPDKDENGNDIPNTTVSRYIMEVVRDVTVTHKGDFPKVEKKIVEGSTKVDINEALMGEPVNYEITGTIPTNITQYNTYYYVFHDTLSKGLTYNNDMKVTVNGVDVTTYFYKKAVENDVGTTNITVGIQDLLALENLKDSEGNPVVGAITHETKVVLTYSADLNKDAVIASSGNPNDVYLQYSNDPNDDGEGTLLPPPPNPEEPTPVCPDGVTPKDEVKTYVTELTILKKDGAGNVLTGAEFTLTGEKLDYLVVDGVKFEKVADGTGTYYLLTNGKYTDVAPVFVDDPATESVDEKTSDFYAETTPNYNKVIMTDEVVEKTSAVNIKAYVDENGIVTFSGLAAGTYTLTETVTPDGYNTISPISFTIEFNPATQTFSVNNNLLWVEADNTIDGEIINVAGTVLPSTGGVGTTMFYVIGAVLFLSAAVVLVTKKRMAA